MLAVDERNATAFAASLAYLKDPGVIRARVLARFSSAPSLDEIAALIVQEEQRPKVDPYDAQRRRDVRRKLETAYRRHVNAILEAERLGATNELAKAAANGDLIAAEHLKRQI